MQPPKRREPDAGAAPGFSEIDLAEGQINSSNNDCLARSQHPIFTATTSGARWRVATVDGRGTGAPFGEEVDGRWPALHKALRLAAANGGLVLP